VVRFRSDQPGIGNRIDLYGLLEEPVEE